MRKQRQQKARRISKGVYNLKKGIVFDIKRYSIHDGPGIRDTVFLKGCPLRCWWCHNPESQAFEPVVLYKPDRCIGCGACENACPNNAIRLTQRGFVADPDLCANCGVCVDVCPAEARELVGKEVSTQWVMEEIEKDVLFFDESKGGVTFSGGEPLSQPEFLEELLMECRKKDIHTAVDTSGYAPTDVIMKIAPYVNLFLYDIKLIDEEKHQFYTGVSNQLILHNLQALSEVGASIWVRIPVIPGVNANREELEAMSRFISTLKGVENVNLLPYHGTGSHKYERLGMSYLLRDLKSPTKEEMEGFSRIFEAKNLEVKIGG